MIPSARGTRLEFGDFQTPLAFAREVTAHLAQQDFHPRSMLEPTCGRGSFLLAALELFPQLERAVGVDINSQYLSELHDATRSDPRVSLIQSDCFTTDWKVLLSSLPQPVLILGNPPWVTSSRLGVLSSANAPEREAGAVKPGIEALTGKSNFDVSEWLLRRWIEAMEGVDARLVMLVKTSVARRVMLQLPSNLGATIRPIAAKKHFGAEVSAGVFDVHAGGPQVLSFRGLLVANPNCFGKRATLAADPPTPWRSGIKHDASKVLELIPLGGADYRNGLGEVVELEETYLFPLLKSSDLSRQATPTPRRTLLTTQRRPGEPTDQTSETAPRTSAYLQRHAAILDARGSSIYKRAPRFGIFGVGPYSFSLWKVATSCLHKKLQFHAIGPHNGRPVVFDDTCAFMSFDEEETAMEAASLLNSQPASEFLQSLIFWDSKRPITIEILRTLSINALRDNQN